MTARLSPAAEELFGQARSAAVSAEVGALVAAIEGLAIEIHAATHPFVDASTADDPDEPLVLEPPC